MSAADIPAAHLRYAAGVDQQAGALAWMPDEPDLRFWIVTSRRTGRWVLPKGGVDPGMTPWDAAAQEALEEAGLHGQTAPEPVGLYRIPKIRPPLIWTVEVTLFPMRVERVERTWLEQNQRERRLVSAADAHDYIAEPEILRLIRAFAATRRLPDDRRSR